MRKGRPESARVPVAGQNAGDDPCHSSRDNVRDEFDSGKDPFEAFDAHDIEAGHTGPRAGASASTGTSFSRTSERFATSSDSSNDGGTTSSSRPARSLKSRAMGYLSRREYSRAELSRKLISYTDNADELEKLLDLLESENWLSDSRFAESLIHRRASRLGASRIVGELKRHAVDATLIEEASSQLRETELARAQAVWRKKYGELPATPAERARQARFLAARGFSTATIGKILKGLDEEWLEG